MLDGGKQLFLPLCHHQSLGFEVNQCVNFLIRWFLFEAIELSVLISCHPVI